MITPARIDCVQRQTVHDLLVHDLLGISVLVVFAVTDDVLGHDAYIPISVQAPTGVLSAVGEYLKKLSVAAAAATAADGAG